VAIDGRLAEPGYYWLAAEWTNLLPSCIDCNRARYHEFPDDVQELRGKANQFPIGNPKKRARRPGSEVNEERLLLHPYFDDPTDFITFVDKGVIQALSGPDGLPLPMAAASITAYGLDRPKLTHARRDVWIRVAGMVKRAKKDLIRANAAPTDQDAQDDLELSIQILKNELAERAVFLGMVRQLVEPVHDLVK
jgi:hypothetical protein